MIRRGGIYYDTMMEVSMNDRGGMYMIGKAFLVLALLAAILAAVAVAGWSKHRLNDALAEQQLSQMRIAEARQAERLPYEAGLAELEYQQRVAQAQSDARKAAALEQQFIDGLAEQTRYQQAQNNLRLERQQVFQTMGVRLIFVVASTTIIVAGTLIGYVLFKNVEERRGARLVEQVEAAPSVTHQTPRRQPDRAEQPQPMLQQSSGVRLPDLPQGRPVRERVRERPPVLAYAADDAPAHPDTTAHPQVAIHYDVPRPYRTGDLTGANGHHSHGYGANGHNGNGPNGRNGHR